MASVKVNIAAALKRARKDAGMSVDQVGAAIGKSGKTISAWEVGRGQPDGDELIVLCKLLDAHLRDFYGEEYEEYVTDRKGVTDLSPDEQELVDLYRGTADFGRRHVLSLAREYREHMPRETYKSALPADFYDGEPEEVTLEDYEDLARLHAEED